MSLVWLFSEHRILQKTCQELEHKVDRLVEQSVELRKDNAALTREVVAAREAIQRNPTYVNSVIDLLQKYQESTLTELPFERDQEPEWLTSADEDTRTPHE